MNINIYFPCAAINKSQFFIVVKEIGDNNSIVITADSVFAV